MRWVKLASLVLMSLFYVSAGIRHFTAPEFYLRIMPPYIPFHEAMVILSGVAEIVLGAALLVPRLRVYAAWGIIALLVAVFPANIHAAVADIRVGNAPIWANWVRLPFQALFIAWAWWHTREAPEPVRAGSRVAAA
jgi:uncharacterized membrane protein